MRIDIRLDPDFTKWFEKAKKKYGDELANLNGLDKKQLNFTGFIDNFIDKNVADASIDGNANVAHKDITTLENEMAKPHSKLIAFNKIFYELKKKWGVDAAIKWAEEEWTGCFYLHDFCSSTYRPYCYAYDLTPIVEKGLYFVTNFNAQPPKHLTTYTDFVGETVSWCSNRTSGAVGLPNFLIYSFYFWKKDCENNFLINSPEYYRDQEFQRIIYKLNQPYLRITQSAFTNFSIFDQEYLVALFGDKKYPDGSYVIDYIDEIIKYQKAFMEVVSKVRSENMMTFPVLTFSCIRKNGRFAHEDFAKWCCKHNMKWADSNFYISDSVTTLSNCCRLQSNIENLGYFNSIGGTSLSVGSIKVNTINLARIAYETKDKDKYLKKLKDRVYTCLKTLDVIRSIIKRNVAKGLLPNYTLELIKMDSQYNTIGINGIYEAVKYLGGIETDESGNAFYTKEGEEFATLLLRVIHEVKDKFIKEFECDYQINIEQVPAERCAAILKQKDNLLYTHGYFNAKTKGEYVDGYRKDKKIEEIMKISPLYGNQWIPLAVKTSLKNKLIVSRELDIACSGGSIAHINLDKPLENFDTAWKLLNDVADMGIPYFAFCTRISACEENHGFYGDTCPVCGKPKVTSYQRIVGFLTPDKTYSKERKAEFAKRDWFELNSYQEM